MCLCGSVSRTFAYRAGGSVLKPLICYKSQNTSLCMTPRVPGKDTSLYMTPWVPWQGYITVYWSTGQDTSLYMTLCLSLWESCPVLYPSLDLQCTVHPLSTPPSLFSYSSVIPASVMRLLLVTRILVGSEHIISCCL